METQIKVFTSDQEGIYLRDYFAAKAMQGLLSSIEDTGSLTINLYSELSYKIADEMIKVRENKQP